jgi:hypothetical protein
MALLNTNDLKVQKVIEILKTEQSKAVARIYKPKGEEVYIFDTNGGNNSKYISNCIMAYRSILLYHCRPNT